MSNKKIVLKFDDEELILPVNPPSFENGASNNNTTVPINNVGDINLLSKNRGLYEITIESFFPVEDYDFLLTEFQKPYTLVKKVKKWFESNLVGTLVIAGTNISMTCSITSFSYGENDGHGDVNYSLTFTEYRNLTITDSTKKKTISKTSKTIEKKSTSRTTKEVKSQTYIVKVGDSLCSIAKKLTGDSSNYKAIANQNNISNPNKISVGQKLIIKV